MLLLDIENLSGVENFTFVMKNRNTQEIEIIDIRDKAIIRLYTKFWYMKIKTIYAEENKVFVEIKFNKEFWRSLKSWKKIEKERARDENYS